MLFTKCMRQPKQHSDRHRVLVYCIMHEICFAENWKSVESYLIEQKLKYTKYYLLGCAQVLNENKNKKIP